MGDFPQASNAHCRNSEVDMAAALRGSISFGRFLSESLDWDKWSAFCQNKYLEEAKNCSVLGSVAQKKAFFEVHYKRAPTRKPSASTESENVTRSDAYEREIADSSINKAENDDRSAEIEALEEHSFQINSPSRIHSPISETGLILSKHSVDKLQEKEALKDISVTNEEHHCKHKEKLAASGLRSWDIHEASRKSFSSASMLRKPFAKENKSPQSIEATRMRSTERRKLTSGLLSMSINDNVIHNGEKQSLVDRVQNFEKLRDPKVFRASSISSGNLHNIIKTPDKAFTAIGSKNSPPIPSKAVHRRAIAYRTSSGRGKEEAKFCSLSLSERENKEQNIRSASPSCKANEKETPASELKKLRKSLCFKARPLPDFYHNREKPKIEQKKNLVTTNPQNLKEEAFRS
ncbi:hypothetical protein AXF42_Ash015193 [Apostasia shenzhenica]|uniref:TPX2 C-terminal domain-containing protein n=1 Tax=Apostasia shenzhenica TaxID=1088818 RepID=A0A2I0AQI9_9ASPA|nr:hypothetical protein AXF42_Ash015193 [Apostasia shenzhenica]